MNTHGIDIELPLRPEPEAPANTAGLEWDAYSGIQMLIYARAAVEADRQEHLRDAAKMMPSDESLEKAWDRFEAEMARCPTDDELEEFMAQFADEQGNIADDRHAEAARAVLSRYGDSQPKPSNSGELGQPAASAEPFAVLAVEKNGSVSVFADSTALSERPIDDEDRQWAASRQAQLVEVYVAPVTAQAQPVVNRQMTTAASDVLADTQRAIIEAAERRGYERAIAECAQDREDAQRLDWLDAQNARFRVGWHVGRAPAGNVRIDSVIVTGRSKLTSIREAIDAARAAKEQS